MKYKEKDARIASAALKKVSNHLWYLSEELVALAFFDETVSIETNNKIREGLNNPSEPNKIKLTTIDHEVIELRQLEDFVTAHTRRLFDILDLPASFLETPAENWAQHEAYCIANNIIQHMNVVSDIAERGVKLIDEYNKLLTNNEEQKLYILEV